MKQEELNLNYEEWISAFRETFDEIYKMLSQIRNKKNKKPEFATGGLSSHTDVPIFLNEVLRNPDTETILELLSINEKSINITNKNTALMIKSVFDKLSEHEKKIEKNRAEISEMYTYLEQHRHKERLKSEQKVIFREDCPPIPEGLYKTCDNCSFYLKKCRPAYSSHFEGCINHSFKNVSFHSLTDVLKRVNYGASVLKITGVDVRECPKTIEKIKKTQQGKSTMVHVAECLGCPSIKSMNKEYVLCGYKSIPF